MFSKISNFDKCCILIGNYLGDATYDNRGSHLISRHSTKQQNYTQWLEYLYINMGILQSSRHDYLYPTQIKPDSRVTKIVCKVPIRKFFETKDFIIYDNNKLTATGNVTYYKKGTKVLSEYALRNIHPFGLLLWYLDDGSLAAKLRLKKDGTRHGFERHAVLCTHCFTYDEHIVMQKVFKERFDIEIMLHKHTSRNPISKEISSVGVHAYMNATNFKKFYNIIRPYIHLIPDDMRYKFDMKYETKDVENGVLMSELYGGY